MTYRRLLVAIAALVTAGASLAVAPSAEADLACAWVDPNGVCISNPLGGVGVPRLPSLPRVPSIPRVPSLP